MSEIRKIRIIRWVNNALMFEGLADSIRKQSAGPAVPQPAKQSSDLFAGLADSIKTSTAQSSPVTQQPIPKQTNPFMDMSSLSFTTKPDITTKSKTSTLQIPTVAQQNAVASVANKIDQYSQKPGFLPGAVKAVSGALGGVNEAMTRTAQDVNPETDIPKTASEKAIDYARAGLSTLNLFPPFLIASSAIQGAENINNPPPKGANWLNPVETVPFLAKGATKLAAQGINSAVGGVSNAGGYAVNSTQKGIFDAYNTLVRGLKRDTSQDIVPSEGSLALGNEAGGFAGLLLAGEAINGAFQKAGEIKARTLTTNDAVESAKNALGIEPKKNLLGQEERVSPSVIGSTYSELAKSAANEPHLLSVLDQAKQVLTDHATLKDSEFHAKYKTPVEAVNSIAQQVPEQNLQQNEQSTPTQTQDTISQQKKTTPKSISQHLDGLINVDSTKVPSDIPSVDLTNSAEKTISAEKGKSLVGKRIEKNAIEKGFSQAFSDTAGYDKITIRDQAERAANLINTDFERAKRIVMGQEGLPEGLKERSIIEAMKTYVDKTGDAKLALELANSPLTTGTSVHAQELRLGVGTNPDSAVSIIQKVKDLKTKIFERKGFNTDKIVEEIKRKIKEQPKEKATKETWASFVDSITC